ncbi:MAG: asparagine synthase [Clostridiales bacterium]|nr:asparagine synthase [Clostridiales bacterium]
MVDLPLSMSSFLALRYIERTDVDFTEKFRYRHPAMPSEENRVLVRTAEEIDRALREQTGKIKASGKKIGLLLSGGMDSGILASYLPGAEAYTFRFLGGEYQKEELERAENFAKINHMTLHYVDISWDTVTENLPKVMRSKGGPVHSIEPQIYQAAVDGKKDGVGVMIIGDASDYVFGGMDRLLSKDWTYDDFIRRYIYVDPFEVLREPVSVRYVFEKYRKGEEGIDFVRILETLAAQESYGSYDNAFAAADMPYEDPYEILKMAEPLDLSRVRNGESKYLIRELFKMRYPDLAVPEKLPMPRPVDSYFADWKGPVRPEFREDIDISAYSGNQKWLMWCLEQFLDMTGEGRT